MNADEDVIKALTIIGNAKKVIKACEPNIAEPMELKEWMVRRTFQALEMFKEELLKGKSK